MEISIIYPHQLYLPTEHPALAPGRPVFLIEEPLLLTEFGTHRQKMLLHRLSLQAYKNELEAAGYTVTYVAITPDATTESVLADIIQPSVTTVHIADTTDDWLESRISATCTTLSCTRIKYESLLFIFPRNEAVQRFVASKKFMKRFYEKARRDLDILIESDGEPIGGVWSFDSDNRQPLKKTITLPDEIVTIENADTVQARSWLSSIESEQYGTTDVWVPYTRAAAETYLETFLHERLSSFGAYEDALSTRGVRLFHSTLSPLLNIGLLSPQTVIDCALQYAKTHEVPLNSLEGFVRQIIGWREFIRASYECDGRRMRTQNFFAHTRPLPASFWTGTTGIFPIDHSIHTALKTGYNHHIERLMVLGNFMLLTKTNPEAVYRWFMAMYVDAYDWVMVPNVYGMSQFADGGSFATKPYISGSAYIKKMSDYPKGDWEPLWTSLYWHFIDSHRTFFEKNHRLSMMPRLFDKMSADIQQEHRKRADAFLGLL
jgi:deoxyribodipyrimidine photolyase-related protein